LPTSVTGKLLTTTPECATGEPDVRGTKEGAERMLTEAMEGLEELHDA
jgi:hypothetical protein